MPTFLCIPVDVQRAEARGGLIEVRPPAVRPVSTEILAAVADLLQTGPRPTLLVGRRAAVAGVSLAVLELARRLAAPIILEPDALGAVPHDDPLCVGVFGVGDAGGVSRWLAQEPPGPLLAIGARLDDTTTNAFSAALLGGGLVQLDEGEERLGRAVATLAACAGDLPGTLARLCERVPRVAPEILALREEAIAALRATAPLGARASTSYEARGGAARRTTRRERRRGVDRGRRMSLARRARPGVPSTSRRRGAPRHDQEENAEVTCQSPTDPAHRAMAD